MALIGRCWNCGSYDCPYWPNKLSKESLIFPPGCMERRDAVIQNNKEEYWLGDEAISKEPYRPYTEKDIK